MQTTVTINGSDATVTIEHTGALAKVQETIEKTALYAFNHGYYIVPDGVDPSTVTFDGLTNNQKLALFTNFVQVAILNAARVQYIEDAVEAARVAADADTGNIFI